MGWCRSRRSGHFGFAGDVDGERSHCRSEFVETYQDTISHNSAVAFVNARLLTLAQVADRLQLSESTVRRLVTSGRLQAVRLGRSLRFEESALTEMIQTCRLPRLRVVTEVTIPPDEAHLQNLARKLGLE